MTAISNRCPGVTIEYTARGVRVRKSFADAYVGRRFYVRQDKLGANPKVVGANTMTTETTTVEETKAAPASKSTKKRAAKKATPKAAPTKKTAKKSAEPKASVKKTAKKAAEPKTNKPAEPKGPVDQATKPIRWTDRKKALIDAMKKVGATSALEAKTVEEISAASKGAIEANQVAHQCNRKFDLTAQGIIASAVVEGERKHRFYLTKKGQKLDTSNL